MRKQLFFLFIYFLCTGCKEQDVNFAQKKDLKPDLLRITRSITDYEEAIENYKSLLAKEPDNIIVAILLGDAYFDIERNEEAIYYYQKALSTYPGNIKVRTDLGTAYRRIGQPNKALEQYYKSLEIDPRDSTTRYNIGVVLLWDKKDPAAAVKTWQELLRIDPYFLLADELRENIRTLEKMKESGHRF